MPIPKHILFLLLFVSFTPFIVEGVGAGEPREQDFLVTAYYSALSGQCCYIRGGVEADRVLNGEGRVAADGTKVFPGLAAAPRSFPFGTRIRLPGLGVFEVHDRGGAITEGQNGVHRLDIWVGAGEEGLAKALTLGAIRVKGTVYPVGTVQPPISVDFSQLPLAWEKLRTYFVAEDGLIDVSPRLGERSLSVYLLQGALNKLGFFQEKSTGLFGPVTQRALHMFLQRIGSSEPWDTLTERGAALITASLKMLGRSPKIVFVGPESTEESVQLSQRLLRFLGYYRGRTDGEYSHNLFRAIYAFQKDHGLVSSMHDVGAGHIGPITREKLVEKWRDEHVNRRADKLLFQENISDTVLREVPLEQFVGERETGSHVRALQEVLADLGFFPREQMNGVFGSLTKESVERFQISRGLIQSSGDKGAGYVGPATLRALRRAHNGYVYDRVRAEGWQNL